MKLLIEEENCKGCLLCVSACPHGLLEPSEKLNEMGYHPIYLLDEDKCTKCTLCATICPDSVIQIP